MRWFLSLSLRRKILFFLAGGMVTLVFDAFVAHFSWNNLTMRWTQAIPIVYGTLTALALGLAAVAPLSRKLEARLVIATGAIGMAVGLTGMTLHSLTLKENLEGETLSLMTVGKALSLSAPLFAPAAFAGVGFLLLALSRIAPAGIPVGKQAVKVSAAASEFVRDMEREPSVVPYA